jgi:hypothetical protein
LYKHALLDMLPRTIPWYNALHQRCLERSNQAHWADVRSGSCVGEICGCCRNEKGELCHAAANSEGRCLIFMPWVSVKERRRVRDYSQSLRAVIIIWVLGGVVIVILTSSSFPWSYDCFYNTHSIELQSDGHANPRLLYQLHAFFCTKFIGTRVNGWGNNTVVSITQTRRVSRQTIAKIILLASKRVRTPWKRSSRHGL